MAGRVTRKIYCDVVDETIAARLRIRRVGGIDGKDEPYAQCAEVDCQYVNKNTPPCPLSAALFQDELDARKRRREARRS